MKQKPKQFELLGANLAALNLAVGFDGNFSAREIAPQPKPVATAGLRAPDGVLPAALGGEDEFANPVETQPQESDFIEVNFRVLSAIVTRPEMSGMILDLTRPGLLEAAVPKLAGKALSKNHWDYDVEDFLGVVSASEFDAAGASTEGIPGINAKLKVSRRIAPKITYGLLMNPPAITAVSAKIFINFEYSHPALAEEVGFYGYLRRQGEERDGQMVRFIVTEIVEFGRLSFVDRGADYFARRLPDDEDPVLSPPGEEIEAETGNKKKQAGMSSQEPPKGEKTMKLSQELIAALGLQGDPATDFAESAVASALPGLATKAQLGTQLLDSLREETRAAALRVAALSHKGEGEAKLGTVDELLIRKADAAELAALKTTYEEQLAASLSATCQSCGAKVTSLRSSVSGNTAADQEAELAADADFAVTLL